MTRAARDRAFKSGPSPAWLRSEIGGRQRTPSPKSKPFERMYRPTPCEGVRDVKPIRSYRIVCMRACVMKVKEVIRR